MTLDKLDCNIQILIDPGLLDDPVLLESVSQTAILYVKGHHHRAYLFMIGF
jgi:hypothetical protein